MNGYTYRGHKARVKDTDGTRPTRVYIYSPNGGKVFECITSRRGAKAASYGFALAEYLHKI